MKSLLAVILAYFGLLCITIAQQSKPDDMILPEDEYLVSQSITRFEDENKQLQIQIRECERLIKMSTEVLLNLKEFDKQKITTYGSVENHFSVLLFRESDFRNSINYNIIDISRAISHSLENINSALGYDYDYNNMVPEDNMLQLEKNVDLIVSKIEGQLLSLDTEKKDIESKINSN